MEQYRKLKLFKCGKQGYTGTLEDSNKTPLVFKVSKKIDYSVEHEYNVLSRLNEFSFCPNFVKVISMLEQQVEPNVKKNTSPFQITSKYPIFKNVLLEEFVPGEKLYHHIKFGTTKTDVVYSIVKQVLNAVAIGQAYANFTHYDLHSDNILLTPCSKDLVYVYAFQKDLAFAVPTLGYTAKIIDCGFSFVDTLKGNYLNSSMGHTDVGFVSDRFDWVSDPKLFLITIKYELEKYRNGTKNFSNIVKNLFSCLTVEWDSGWDDFGGRSAADSLLHDLEKKFKFDSKVFDKHSPFALDLLCNLIILPLEKKKFDNIFISYKAFVTEFMKIEDNIGSTQYNLWILKCIVESARKHKEIYLQNNEEGLTQFRRDIHHAIMKVSKFCSPRQIHYEKMLVSLYNFASCAEGYFYNFMEKKMKKKYEEYDDIPVRGIIDIIRILSCNLEDKYVYNENTKVIVVDIENQTQVPLEPFNDLTLLELNSLSPELRGMYLYSKYNDSRSDVEENDDDNEDEDENESIKQDDENESIKQDDENESIKQDDENESIKQDDENEDEEEFFDEALLLQDEGLEDIPEEESDDYETDEEEENEDD